MDPGAPRARRLPPLELIVFVVGSSTLGAEIAAARLMAPFFGASTVVWANTIAVVLVALSVGYWFGGRMADRRPDQGALSLLVLVAAALLALVPIVSQPFLSLSVSAFDDLSLGAGFGSLLGVLALVAIPVLMLGAVSPWAIRLKLESIEDSGETAGRMYAISTVGSLLGTFLSALLLIPLAGTQRTFLTFALALALVAAVGLPRRWWLVPLGIAALFAVPVGTVKAAEDGKVIHETDTTYQYARVIDHPNGDRTLELNEGQAIHSLYRPRSVLTGGYWDGYLVTPFSTRPDPPRRIAILGFAGGTIARAYAHYFPSTIIDGVEIDGELFDIGHRYFGLRKRPQLREHTEDARPFLRRTDERYDLIFLDTYRQPYIPFYLATREFFELARERLAPGGVVVVNVGAPEGEYDLEKVLSATMGDVFAHVARDPVEDT
ncbi:MAG TPA: fused MFS/spermidine synthase, partial [Gaiellaceae bacterium]|nr:fused MFS/spermidine synthase [Gaiellaceae bacterium]